MSDFDKRLKAMAGAEICPVPEGFEGRMEKQLEELNETKVRKLRPARWALIAACLCVVLVGTAVATNELGELDYCTWATYERSFSGCETAIRTQKYDMEVPEQIGEFSFDSLQKLYVVPEGTQFLDAISGSAIYRPLDITYRDYDDTDEEAIQRDLSVCIGKTDQAYWSTYFSFDPVTLEFTPDAEWLEAYELTQTEYKGLTIYLYSKKEMEQNQPLSQRAVWVDQNLGVCFAVSFGLSSWLEDISTVPQDRLPGDIMPYVEFIIDHFG